MRLPALVFAVALLAGCASSPPPESSTALVNPPPLRDLVLTLKNDASEPRVCWVELYSPDASGRMSGAPDRLVELGTLGQGESVTKTVPVPVHGWYRVVGARSEGDKGDRRVKFMGGFTKVGDANEATVRIAR